MGRWAHLDSDEERLPEGIRRTGYDADTQTYTYTDANGNAWVGVPGARYGTLRRANTEPRRAPSLPVYKSDEADMDIKGEEPAQVLYDPDTDLSEEDEKREPKAKPEKKCNTTFDAILGPQKSPITEEGTGSATAFPKKAHLRRWNSVSKAVNKFIPRLPPLPPGDVERVGITEKEKIEAGGDAREENGGEKPLPTLPRRRASTMSRFTRSAAQGVKQMFSDESEFRGRRGY